ncbi:MAG: hypothetical protein HYW88_01555 [Candidatus Sungbacteria bacterium]|nr:hypothetical protein [Candidatus Sungbacteria bacterium]
MNFGPTAKIPNLTLTANQAFGGWVLTFTVPVGIQPGTYQVSVTNGVGTSANGKSGATSNLVPFTVTGAMTTGTVHYRETFTDANGVVTSRADPITFTSKDQNGALWSGTVNFPFDVPNAPFGYAWTETYVSGGPPNSTFVNITPSATQSLTSTSGDITFTFNFVSNF